MAAIAGKDIMIFVDGSAIAMATNHTLTLNTETSETSSKDTGLWGDERVTRLRWEASSDSFVDGIGSTSSFATLFDLWKAGEAVDISLAGSLQPWTRRLMEKCPQQDGLNQHQGSTRVRHSSQAYRSTHRTMVMQR